VPRLPGEARARAAASAALLTDIAGRLVSLRAALCACPAPPTDELGPKPCPACALPAPLPPAGASTAVQAPAAPQRTGAPRPAPSATGARSPRPTTAGPAPVPAAPTRPTGPTVATPPRSWPGGPAYAPPNRTQPAPRPRTRGAGRPPTVRSGGGAGGWFGATAVSTPN
jgi:hypothetical protein